MDAHRYGLFLFMGFSSLGGNQFAARIRLWMTDPAMMPDVPFAKVPLRVMHGFTAVQVACFAALWGIKKSPFGLLFPLFILLLQPLRNWVLPRVWDEKHLLTLDSLEH